MPISVPGSKPGPARLPCHGGRVSLPRPPAAGRRARGFTLLELIIVVALIAIASASVGLALRDPAATRLEREATRLAALLESARAESRALGIGVIWLPRPGTVGDTAVDYRFVGLPDRLMPSLRWLEPGVIAEVVGATDAAPGVTLGPEPMIQPARIVLRLADQRIVLASDGLGPFQIESSEAAAPADAGG